MEPFKMADHFQWSLLDGNQMDSKLLTHVEVRLINADTTLALFRCPSYEHFKRERFTRCSHAHQRIPNQISMPRNSQRVEWWDVYHDEMGREWYCNPLNDAEFIIPHVNNNSWEKYVWHEETWFFHPQSGRSVRVPWPLRVRSQ